MDVLRLLAKVRYHWPLLVCLTVAFGLRLWNLFPTFFYGDDAEYATIASYLANDPRDLRYPEIEQFGPQPFVSQPPVALYLFALLGNLLGDIEAGAVLTSVFLGTATVGILYGLGFLAHGRTAGALAGVFLAVQPFHVEMSRKAYLDATLTFFMTLAVFCFVLWTRRRTATWALGTGIAAAGAVLSKLPGILILAPLLAALVWGFFETWRKKGATLPKVGDGQEPPPQPPMTRYQAMNRLALHTSWATLPLLVGALAYLGLLFYLKSLQDLALKLGFQYSRVAESAPATVQTHRPWHFYFSHADFGLVAQLGFVIFLLAVAGVIYAFLQWPKGSSGRMAQIALLLWPLSVLVFFTWAERKEWFYLLPAMPPLTFLAGVGAAALVAKLASWLSRSQPLARRVRTFVVVGVLLLAVVPTATPAYRSVNDVVLKERPYGYGVKEAALLVHALDPDAAQVGTILGRFTLHFYNQQPAYHWYVDHVFVEEEIEAGRVRFIVLDTHLRIAWEEEWMRGLAQKYDGKEIRTYETSPGKVKVTVYDLHPDQDNASPGTA